MAENDPQDAPDLTETVGDSLSIPSGFELGESLTVETGRASGVVYSVKPRPTAPEASAGETVSSGSFLPSFLRQDAIDPAYAAGDQMDIEIVYTGDPSYQWAFERSAERWEEILTGDLPDTFMGSASAEVRSFIDNSLIDDLAGETIDDIRIYAQIAPIDGPSNILGAAGPYYLRSDGDQLPVVGVMVFDSADVVALEQDGSLQSTILHEMGHVLGGLDYYWQINGFQGATGTADYFKYSGGEAYNAYSTTYGGTESFVEIEADGGEGTAGSHWDEAIFGRELMTGFLNGGPRGEQISNITIGMFEDIGFTVDNSRADAYRIVSEQGGSDNVPEFTSYEGSRNAAIDVTEGETAAAQAETTDLDGDAVTYQIYLGDDRDHFRIDAISGALSFVTAPSEDTPTDDNGDGTYSVTMRCRATT